MYNPILGIDYYTVKDADTIFETIKANNKLKFTGGGGKRKEGQKSYRYLDISCGFDIETTNLDKYISAAIQQEVSCKISIMYIWQFCIVDDSKNDYYCIIGRTWEEFKLLLDKLEQHFVADKNKKSEKTNYVVPIFIHNLSFELTFILPYITRVDTVFAVKPSTPLYCRTACFEFRCAYLLSGVALKDLPTTRWKKMVNDLDYSKTRHQKSYIDDTEMSYCLADVLVLCEYISQKRKQDGSVGKMCYTKTGYTRRGLRIHCMGSAYWSDKKKRYIDLLNLLQLDNDQQYEIMVNAFQGGHTVANPFMMGKIIENVTCFDFTSSYPTVMVCEPRFPRKHIGYKFDITQEQYENLLSQGYAIVSMCTIKNLRTKKGRNYDSWISLDKCWFSEILVTKEQKETVKEFREDDNVKIDTDYIGYNNGKVAWFKGELTTYITNIDYEIYKEFYEWDEITFQCCDIYETGYLPKPIIEFVLKKYADKTIYKGDPLHLLEYCLGKEDINALYGLCSTKPAKINNVIDLETGKWSKETEDMSEEEIQKLIFDKVCDYNLSIADGKTATVFIWGLYVSAIARQNLSFGIIEAGDKGLFCYSDTDSIYVKDADQISDFIEAYNAMITDKMETMCEFYGFDKDIWKPKTLKGVEKPLGFWDNDGHSKYFKTLGAKRYIKIDDDDFLHITVAGLSKEHGARELASYDPDSETVIDKDGIEQYLIKDPYIVFNTFDGDLVINDTGKLTHQYFYGDYKGKVTDYNGVDCDFEAISGTYLCDSKFSMSINDLYTEYLLGIEESTRM